MSDLNPGRILEMWVERGAAPTQLVASDATAGKIARTRSPCPYPQMALRQEIFREEWMRGALAPRRLGERRV